MQGRIMQLIWKDCNSISLILVVSYYACSFYAVLICHTKGPFKNEQNGGGKPKIRGDY